MIRFDPYEWDRAGIWSPMVQAPYLMTTNVVSFEGVVRERLISPPHSHPESLIAWCYRGTAWLHLRDALYRLTSGQGLWIPAGTAHTAHQEHDSIACFTYVPGRARSGGLNEIEPVAIPRAVQEMLLYLDTDEVGHDLRIQLQESLIELLRTPAGPALADDCGRVPLPTGERVQGIVRQVLESPGERISLVDLSRAHSLHERTVARIFRDEVGMSFGRWRTVVRMTHAKGLIAAGATVATIAARCGYESASAFAAAFKMHTGLSPREFTAHVARSTQYQPDAAG